MSAPLPYQPPITKTRLGGWIRSLHAAVLLYPVLLAAAFYGPWFGAWAALGRRPRLYLDDPSATAGLSYPVAGGIVALLPGAAVLLLLSVVFRLFPIVDPMPRRRPQELVWLGGTLALWIGMLWLIRADPLGVVNWWFD